jgi:hypothetical protein
LLLLLYTLAATAATPLPHASCHASHVHPLKVRKLLDDTMTELVMVSIDGEVSVCHQTLDKMK